MFPLSGALGWPLVHPLSQTTNAIHRRPLLNSTATCSVFLHSPAPIGGRIVCYTCIHTDIRGARDTGLGARVRTPRRSMPCPRWARHPPNSHTRTMSVPADTSTAIPWHQHDILSKRLTAQKGAWGPTRKSVVAVSDAHSAQGNRTSVRRPSHHHTHHHTGSGTANIHRLCAKTGANGHGRCGADNLSCLRISQPQFTALPLPL